MMQRRKPLEGLKILELGQLLAGPFASVLLAWFGAEVIKVEPPGTGDPLRRWRAMHNGTALWWYILGRNKKCITVNLRTPKGQEIVRRLAAKVDVVLENFKPGTMEKWNLGPEQLSKINPRLIFTRVSGWGQTGPYSPRPGYASVAEGVGGLRYVTGYPDRAPVRSNLSLGDTIAGLHAALGILIAIYSRDVGATQRGQVVDVAIYESVFNLMESMLPEYDKLGVVRERQGSKLTGIVPTNTYSCTDGYVIIGGNGDSIFKRLMNAIGRSDLAADPRLEQNDGRVRHEELIDHAISAWSGQRTYQEAVSVLEAAGVPAGPIYSIADILRDSHYQARGIFEDTEIAPGETVKLPAFAPKFSETPGGTEWAGPPLGAHNAEIFGEWLGMSSEEIERLSAEGIIGTGNSSADASEAPI
ncbi:MAG TPA: CaiB/BaiF CoA-transferase family protein [Candidatus Dormibacteraeota bacterium]|nr:CaiB/BaiF CoA-transferase family protein [Candidatus Dormibacteraeota bacterium]